MTAPEEERKDEHAHKVTYYRYDKVREETNYTHEDGSPKFSEHLKLCKHTTSIGQFMDYYRDKLKFFSYHHGYMRLTSCVRTERQGISPGDVTLMMDYSEKLNKLQRQQVQSQHWSNTAMTIEVAVVEGYRACDEAGLAALSSDLQNTPASERGKLLEERHALEKRIYYHCSDYKPQTASVTTHNMEVMLKELISKGMLGRPGGCTSDSKLRDNGYTVWLKTDGCAKQYKCGKAMYLLCKLAAKLNVTIDQMLEVTGHGKDEADGHGGVFKNWLQGEMMRGDFVSEATPIIEAADVADGEHISMAQVLTQHAAKGLGELKPAEMNRKRRAQSNTVSREFRTYEESDIREAPDIKPMTDDLSRDAPVDADSRTKATFAHNNYRADPELQTGAHYVIAVRRIACRCNGCARALQRPIMTRYSPHEACERFPIWGKLNDWKLVTLKPTDEEACAHMEADEDLVIQDKTDGMAACIAQGDMLAMVGTGEHAPNGYYIVEALSAAYETENDMQLELLDEDGKPITLPKGSLAVDCIYWNRQLPSWYTRYDEADERGRVTVPSHMILKAGITLARGSDVAPAPPKKAPRRSKAGPTMNDLKRQLAEKALVMPSDVHEEILEELDARDLQ